ncbi:MAG: hypothetical protein IJ060_13105 [Oscillospiraceae bacterium]|nr:hypothetical protein [Oscillospiraceae bacterium]
MKKKYPLRGCYFGMGTSIAHVSQSETAQFAFGKHGVPKPAELFAR